MAKWLPARALLIVLLLTLVGIPRTHAQGDEAGALRQTVEQLQRTVERLNAQVESLQRQLSGHPDSNAQVTPGQPPPATAAPATTGNDRPEARWQRITRGMTFEEVEALLGHPHKTIDLSPKTIWYYSYPDVGNGSVVFADERGVIDWQTPPFSTWW